MRTVGAPAERTRAGSSGPGRLLIAVYGIFAISASARAAYQMATKFSEAPVAYVLTAFAAAVYIVATVSMAKTGTRWYWTAVASVAVEFAGVLAVGVASVLNADAFPSDTVWSGFGQGYGYVPLVLPLIGLLWLYRRRPSEASGPGGAG